ncbi:MAG: hypothetical protein ACRC42_03095, partial [Mycoplasma sp.]
APVVTDNQSKKDKDKKNVNAQKGQKDNTDDLLKEEDPESLIIPKDNIKNCYFGDLIDVLIEIRYDEENKKITIEKLNFKNIFRYIPIKISLIGQDFSGKKTQAKILSENFPLKIYDLEKMVGQAWDMLTIKSESQTNFMLSVGTNNLNATNNANSLNGPNINDPNTNTIAQMRTEQAKEEEKYAHIKELAQSIKESLLNGESISDEIYSELLIEYIKMDFPIKTDDQVIEDIKLRVENKERILDDIERNKEENKNRKKNFEIRDKEWNEELMKLSLEASKGFVTVNYPSTYSQARTWEAKLSGYIPENESSKLNSVLLKNVFSIVLDRSEEIKPPIKLIQGGFDLVFYLDVPTSECIRRAVGRRLYKNPKTGEMTIYHLEDNQPSTDTDICENLIKVDDISNCESSLVTRHLAFETAVDQIVKFYEPFGFEKKQLRSFHQIDGNKGKDYVTQDLLTYVNQWVELNEENDNEIYENDEEDEGEDTFDEDNHNNISGLNENMIMDDPNQIQNASLNNANQNANNVVQTQENSNRNKSPNKKGDEKEEWDQTEQQLIASDNNNNQQDAEREEQILDPYSEYIKKIEELKASLNKELAEVLLKLWSKIFENYVNECKSIFKFLRVQRESVSTNYNWICQKFIDFLKRPSKKQIWLLDYQMKYNKFLDDYPDLKDDPQVKEEHHQEV